MTRSETVTNNTPATDEDLSSPPIPLCPDPELPPAAAPQPDPDPDLALAADPVDEHEFERLRLWRRSRAGGLPAYTVASNAALEAILRARPIDMQQLQALHGIGPTFCMRHGESLLAELTDMWNISPAPRSRKKLGLSRPRTLLSRVRRHS